MWEMRLSLRLLLKSLLLIVGINSFAQTSYNNTSYTNTGCKPPFNRVRWHDLIDASQRNALKSFHGGNNEEVKYYTVQALTKGVDDLQCSIEKDSLTKDQPKVGYLRGLDDLVRRFTALYKLRQFNASNLPAALKAYEECMMKDERKQTIQDIIDRNPYQVDHLLIECGAFRNNIGIRAAQNITWLKYLDLNPDEILITLKKHPDLPYRDSMIKVVAYRDPKRLYDFAQAHDWFGDAIANVRDSMVMAITKMARGNKSGQLYFPFLDNIIAGKISFEDIDRVKNDDVNYYKLLVQTRLDYVSRYLNGERIISMGDLDTMLRMKAIDPFVTTINALHEKPDAVRFTILDQLNAQELYYIAIEGETELYTSSYVHGVFPKMMQRYGNRGDSLLISVNFDRFKKFIKMAAGYNTLSEFLASIPDKDRARLLMTAFVNNLEKSKGLEDGVDVADSYASIYETIKPVANEMLNNIKLNLDRNIKENNKRGAVMYNLLYKLFLSVDSTQNIDLTKEFGIPPVYNLSYQSLIDDTAGKVVVQVFFYGDDDGKMNYNGFLSDLNRSGAWKLSQDSKYWLAYTSTKGKPVVIYANKWFDDEKDEGIIETAQGALDQYLKEKGIEPTIIVHRGHSYWVKYTIDQIEPAAKIVLLGSCGGYNVVHSVLQHAPDAHIIASKQTGKKDINQPFMNILNEKLRDGSDIDWISLWKEFRARAGNVEGFDDYVPPYKNLGALFIKAYNSSMGTND